MNNSIYDYMKNLISTKFYRTGIEIENKITVFHSVDTLNDEEFSELMMLIEQNYNT